MPDALQSMEDVLSYNVLLLDEKPRQEKLQAALSQYGVTLDISREVPGLKQLRKNTNKYHLVVIGRHTNQKKCERYMLEHLGGAGYITALTSSDELLVQQIRAAKTKAQHVQTKIETPIYGMTEQGAVLQFDVKKECIVVVEQFYQTFFKPNNHKELFGGRLTPGLANIPVAKSSSKQLYMSITVDFKDVFLVAVNTSSPHA